MKIMLLPGMHWYPYSLKCVMNYKAYESDTKPKKLFSLPVPNRYPQLLYMLT